MSAVTRQTQLSEAATDAQEEDGMVLRQPVLTRDKKVAGYLFTQADDAVPKDDPSFLKHLESMMASAMLGQRRAFAAIPCRLLSDPLLAKLASAGVIVLVRFEPDAGDIDRFAERLQSMKNASMQVGLADARVALGHPALGNCASLGFLPVDVIIPPDLLESARQLTTRFPRMKLCASGVNSHEEFEVCRRLRMHGFIGPFATHRRDWQANTIDPGTLRLCKLVNSLRAGAEMDAIIKDIKLDPLLSYRILCYANSAAIGAQYKILALKDAILLIGREPLFRWLVLLLCASAPEHVENGAMLENALVRGRMMELLAAKVSQIPPEVFFLTGVLSLLDVILQLPAPALIEALDLPEDVRLALIERKGPYAHLLQLAEASEQGRAEGISDLCAKQGIEPLTLCKAQTEALNWARRQTQDDAEESTFIIEQPVGGASQIDQSAHEQPCDELAATQSISVPELEAAQRGDPEAQCAMAARYARGEAVTQDLAKSLAWYIKAAQQGNPNAQWNAAVMQAQGRGGIDPDVEQAALWCQKAADQGFAPAQATLGRMYATGQGVEKDMDKALALFQQAAQQGDMEARYNLAALYEQWVGDPDQAFVWYSRAAEQGLPAAQERLGLMYATGQSVAQDLVEAHKWFFIASERKHQAAKANLAHSLTLMEPDQVKEAEIRAGLWIEHYAATGQRA